MNSSDSEEVAKPDRTDTTASYIKVGIIIIPNNRVWSLWSGCLLWVQKEKLF